MVVLKFKDAVNTNRCFRRTLFHILNIRGKPQYFSSRSKYLRMKIEEYLLYKFGATDYSEGIADKKGFLSKFSENERLRSEDTYELIDNLKSLISSHRLVFAEINRPIMYKLPYGEIILEVDAIGMFEDSPALFKITPSSKFKKYYALELAAAIKVMEKELELDTSGYKLIVLKVGNGEYKDFSRFGERKKDGSQKKRGLKSWDSLYREAKDIMERAITLQQDMHDNPGRYNSPRFGSCATCEYHNVKINLNGQNITCIG